MHIPQATVTNATGGAVSDAEAQSWAAALSRAGAWEYWADNNDQPSLLNLILAPSLQNPMELTDMHAHAVFNEPAGCTYPTHVTVEPMGADGQAYFIHRGQSPASAYVLVTTYAPCTATVTVNGSTSTFFSFTSSNDTTLQAGALKNDAGLGEVWYVDGFGGCSDTNPAPPAAWCSR